MQRGTITWLEADARNHSVAKSHGRRGILIAMPMGALHHPSLGLSLLQGILRKRGFKCDVKHFYLDFAEFLGTNVYETLNDDRYFLALTGEWAFSGAAHGENKATELEYVSRILLGEYKEFISAKVLLDILEARKKIPEFIDRCLSSISWDQYDFVGFSSSFQQNTASLALAKRIKAQLPRTLIIFGGANCEGEMGHELLAQYSYIDVVVGGEAEESLPRFLTNHFSGRNLSVPGVATRSADFTRLPSTPLERMDELPHIDYTDFLREREDTPSVAGKVPFVPLFESSRGCWWGEKNHCTFCGLNARGMAYRSKSPSRALQEIQDLADQFGREILVVDNILDRKYFDNFLPELSMLEPPLLLHYEVKVNLSETELASLASAGVRKIQPGIESLCSKTLREMKKGTSMLRNVQTLKLAAEAGIFVEWGYLYGFPEDSACDVRDVVVSLLPLLTHLTPPSGFTRVRADRFSPYFDEPEKYGIRITPLPAYKYVYPHAIESLTKLAYHFDIHRSSKQDGDLEMAYGELRAGLKTWCDESFEAALYFCRDGDGAFITDSRGSVTRRIELNGIEAFTLETAAQIVGIRQLSTQIQSGYGPVDIESVVLRLVSNGLLLREGDAVLSLPLRQPGWKRAPVKEEIRNSLKNSYFYLGKSL